MNSPISGEASYSTTRLNGVEHMLRQIRWQFFFTLTFSCHGITEKRAKQCFLGFKGRLLRKCIGKSAKKRQSALYMVQIEFGKSLEHIHLHGMFAGLPSNVSCDDIRNIWECCIHEGGKAEVTTYDPNRDGVSYVMKFWRDPQQVSLIQSNECWPIYSESLLPTLRRGKKRTLQC